MKTSLLLRCTGEIDNIVEERRGRDLDELVEVDALVLVDIRVPEHHPDLLRRLMLAQFRQRLLQLRIRYVPVLVLIEHLPRGSSLVAPRLRVPT